MPPDAVFRSRDAAALPALEQALAKESDGQVRAALEEARAAIILNKPDRLRARQALPPSKP